MLEIEELCSQRKDEFLAGFEVDHYNIPLIY